MIRQDDVGERARFVEEVAKADDKRDFGQRLTNAPCRGRREHRIGPVHEQHLRRPVGITKVRERARGLLRRKEVEFSEVVLDETPDERETMMQRSGGRRSVPQIFIGERHVGGYDELAALDRSGELDRLLGRA